MTEFKFTPEHDGTLPLRTAVLQAIGAASVCWEPMDCTGVFDEAQAVAIADALIAHISAAAAPQEPE